MKPAIETILSDYVIMINTMANAHPALEGTELFASGRYAAGDAAHDGILSVLGNKTVPPAVDRRALLT